MYSETNRNLWSKTCLHWRDSFAKVDSTDVAMKRGLIFPGKAVLVIRSSVIEGQSFSPCTFMHTDEK